MIALGLQKWTELKMSQPFMSQVIENAKREMWGKFGVKYIESDTARSVDMSLVGLGNIKMA